MLSHGGKGSVLSRLGDTENNSRVLHGEEALGNVNVKKDGGHKRADSDEESGCSVLQDDLQGAPVKSDDGVEYALGGAKEPALLFLFLVLQQLRAHHGSQRKGNESGNEDGDGKSDGKLAEEAADDVPHEEKRDEHGDEGDGKRNDGEANLLGALESGFDRRIALLDKAADIFDHDDGVVDDKAGRYGQGHEG